MAGIAPVSARACPWSLFFCSILIGVGILGVSLELHIHCPEAFLADMM